MRFLVLALMLFCLASPGMAAGLKSSQSATLEQTFNPHPDPNDIVLPMPHGLSMVFKAVEVPAQGFLWDTTFNMGMGVSGRPELDYYDRRFSAVLAAPFSAADLPAAWQPALPTNARIPFFYYFMGKYEISEAQWQVIMEGEQPGSGPAPTLTDQSSRPKTNISWYDTQEFIRRYNQWLLDQYPDSLPKFSGDDRNMGFVRLPMEAEWEYAARGGSRVTQEVLRQEEFYPLGADTTLPDYAVFTPLGAPTVQEKPLSIGSRLPNPLGLFDMAGNVSEMVQDSFRFSLGGRLHGSAGGYVRKGGSYLSTNSEIMPGAREEVAFFNRRGPVNASDLGLRLTLSGINTPGGERMQTLTEEWTKIGESQRALLSANPENMTDSPLEQIDKLLAATTDPLLAEPLTRLRVSLKDSNIALDRERAASAEGLVRTMLYLSETIRNYGVRYDIAYRRTLEITQIIEDAKKKKTSPEKLKPVQDALAQFQDAQKEMLLAMESSANFYKGKLEESASYPAELIDYSLNLVANELNQENLLAKNMRQNLDIYTSHLNIYRTKPNTLTKNRILKDILPDNLEKGLKLD